jgi:LysR family cys regulon transcriptional activator
VVVPPGHPLAVEADRGEKLTLRRLAAFPVITYETGFTGRSHIDDAFEHEGLAISPVLSAMDADVIKTYVELGMGVGIIAAMAYDDARDTALRSLDAGHLFATNVTHIAVRRGTYLRDFMYDFIRTFAAPLDRTLVDRALASEPGSRIEI